MTRALTLLAALDRSDHRSRAQVLDEADVDERTAAEEYEAIASIAAAAAAARQRQKCDEECEFMENDDQRDDTPVLRAASMLRAAVNNDYGNDDGDDGDSRTDDVTTAALMRGRSESRRKPAVAPAAPPPPSIDAMRCVARHLHTLSGHVNAATVWRSGAQGAYEAEVRRRSRREGRRMAVVRGVQWRRCRVTIKWSAP